MEKSEKVENQLEMITFAYEGISQRLAGHKCPICGAEQWWYDSQVRYQLHYNLDENNNIDTSHTAAAPVISVICNNCGYEMQFNIQRALNFIPNGKGLHVGLDAVTRDNYRPLSENPELIKAQEELRKSKEELANLKAEMESDKSPKKTTSKKSAKD